MSDRSAELCANVVVHFVLEHVALLLGVAKGNVGIHAVTTELQRALNERSEPVAASPPLAFADTGEPSGHEAEPRRRR